MKIVGLTGGIGSGKTTVAGFFKELGIPVFIADEAGRELMATSEAVKTKIISAFGEQSYEGSSPNRKFLASRVFNDARELTILNSIVHPAVNTYFETWLSKQKSPYIIYEAAILFESGGYKKCDFIILVTATYQERINRLLKRDQTTVKDIEARIQNQWSDEKKLNLTDFQIKNEDFSSTRNQVRNIHEILLKHSKN